MFLNEAWAGGAAQRPNVVQTNEVVEDWGSPIIAVSTRRTALAKMPSWRGRPCSRPPADLAARSTAFIMRTSSPTSTGRVSGWFIAT